MKDTADPKARWAVKPFLTSLPHLLRLSLSVCPSVWTGKQLASVPYKVEAPDLHQSRQQCSEQNEGGVADWTFPIKGCLEPAHSTARQDSAGWPRHLSTKTNTIYLKATRSEEMQSSLKGKPFIVFSKWDKLNFQSVSLTRSFSIGHSQSKRFSNASTTIYLLTVFWQKVPGWLGWFWTCYTTQDNCELQCLLPLLPKY